MAEVTIRELRNRGGDVIDRVEAGEHVIVTRSGKPVAELRALRPSGISAEALVERRRRLPDIDPNRFRSDIDRLIDSSL